MSTHLVRKAGLISMLEAVDVAPNIEIVSTEGGLVEYTWAGASSGNTYTSYAIVTDINAGLVKIELFNKILGE